MGNPLRPGVFDVNADSYGRYGANAGIHRLMRVLDRAGISANVFTSGALAERDPDQVRAVARAGHEIVAHGYAQDLVPATLSAEEDEDYIRRTTASLTEVIGSVPTGWVSPRATAGDDTSVVWSDMAISGNVMPSTTICLIFRSTRRAIWSQFRSPSRSTTCRIRCVGGERPVNSWKCSMRQWPICSLRPVTWSFWTSSFTPTVTVVRPAPGHMRKSLRIARSGRRFGS